VKLVGAQANRRGGEILLEMRYRGGPGDWQHGGGTLQQPGERNLVGLFKAQPGRLKRNAKRNCPFYRDQVGLFKAQPGRPKRT